MITTIYKPGPITSLLRNQYKNLVLKPCLRFLSNRDSYPTFWTMPYDTICREILINGYYEKELLIGMTLIVKNKSGTVLDIGANIGNHTIFFSRAFKQVISFEPVPRNCWILKANLHLNGIANVVLVEKALGEKNEFQFLAHDDPCNTNNGLSLLPQGQIGIGNRVEVVRGDDALRTLNVTAPVTLIKVDVEGLEREVIKGLEETIRGNRPTICWEAYTSEAVLPTRTTLEDMGYRNFYHLTTNKFANRYMNRMANSFGKAVYLVPLDQCKRFDGMNVASSDPIQ